MNSVGLDSWAITRYPGGAYRPLGIRGRVTWDQVLAGLRDPLIRPDIALREDRGDRKAKLLLPAWSPATFRKDTRANVNCEAVTMLVLDYDTSPPSPVWERYRRAAHTTWSHDVGRDRWRLILPLREPIPVGEWPDVWRWVRSIDTRIDPQAGDPARCFLRPAIRGEIAPYEARDYPGDTLLPGRVLLPPPAPVSASRRALSAGEREAIGASLGARARGAGEGRAYAGIKCPSCGRPSVYFLVTPTRDPWARCNHRGGCGWWGAVDDIGGGR